MKLAEKIIKAYKSTEIVESKSQEIIKELMATGFGGDNENQMKAVQLLKGLATSDEEESNAFMAKLDKALKGISESLEMDIGYCINESDDYKSTIKDLEDRKKEKQQELKDWESRYSNTDSSNKELRKKLKAV
jgi:Skp family chaperone for outer membrane proteins